MSKFRLLFTSFFALLCLGAKAQYSEIGITGGGTNFIGDVGHYGPHVPQGWYAGAFYRYNFDSYYSLRAGFNYGIVRNEDALSDIAFRQNRNLSFESPVYEGSLILEFNYWEFISGSSKKNHTTYIFAGLGIFNYNPRAELDGNMINLQPLGTEGQGTPLSDEGPYGLMALNIPFGMGYKWSVSRKLSLQLEIGARRTYTDYLDDVSGYYVDPDLLAEHNGEEAGRLSDRSLDDSPKADTQRGSSNDWDWYVFSGIGLVWRLGSNFEKCAQWH